LCVHNPVWTEPVLTATLARLTELPVVLLGNFRPETSGIVGILGAGGALDQIGLARERVFDHRSDDARRSFLAFIRAAVAVKRLKGQTLGIFGGRSLGMITATADPSQWQRVFGVDIDHVDQLAIVEAAKAISSVEVPRHTSWLLDRLGKVEFGGLLDRQALER